MSYECNKIEDANNTQKECAIVDCMYNVEKHCTFYNPNYTDQDRLLQWHKKNKKPSISKPSIRRKNV